MNGRGTCAQTSRPPPFAPDRLLSGVASGTRDAGTQCRGIRRRAPVSPRGFSWARRTSRSTTAESSVRRLRVRARQSIVGELAPGAGAPGRWRDRNFGQWLQGVATPARREPPFASSIPCRWSPIAGVLGRRSSRVVASVGPGRPSARSHCRSSSGRVRWRTTAANCASRCRGAGHERRWCGPSALRGSGPTGPALRPRSAASPCVTRP